MYNGSSWEYWNGTSFGTTGTLTAIDTVSQAGLTGISCNFFFSSTFCVAVDSKGNYLTYNVPAPWTIQNVTSDAFTSVSCTQSSYYNNCEVVDANGYVFLINNSSAYYGWNGTDWAASGPYTPIDSSAMLTSIYCPVATASNEGACVISDGRGNVFTLDTYSTTTLSASLTEQSYDPGNNIVSVGCEPGVLYCDLFDGIGQVVQFDSPTYGSQWSPPANIDTNPLNSVSCYSSSACMAVDSKGNALIGTYSSSSWSWAEVATGDTNSLTSVSCVSGPFCLAVDTLGNAYYTTTGTSWSQTASTLDTNPLNSVSCWSSLECTAVDSSGNTDYYNGSTWTLTPSGDTSFLSSVYCPTPPTGISNSCIIGASDSKIIYDSSNGFGNDSISSNFNVKAVSCATYLNCIAVDTVGDVSYSNGITTGDVLDNNDLNPGQPNTELSNYQMVLTSNLSVPYPGSATINITVNGLFNLAFGKDANGATAGLLTTTSASLGTLTTGLLNSSYQSVIQEDQQAVNTTMTVTIDFPEAGQYPLELDYGSIGGIGQIELANGLGDPIPSNIPTPACPSQFSLSNYVNPTDGGTPFVVCSASGANRYVSFDQTPISADITLPVTNRGKLPLMVQFTGGNGDKTTFETTTVNDTTNYLGQKSTDFNMSDFSKFNNAYYANKGYDVLTYTPRGVGASCGAETETSSGTSYSNMTDPRCRPISAVNCPNASGCIALDATGHDIVSNGNWQTYLNTGDTNGFTAISCVASNDPVFCAGVDDAGNLYYSSDATNYNSQSTYAWSAPSTQVDSGTSYSSLYCISAVACLAGDTNGNLIYFNGSSEVNSGNIDFNNTITSIYCVSSSDCIAADSTGQTLTFAISSAGVISNLTISQVANNSVLVPIPLTSLSCVSTALCVAGDAMGDIFTSSDPFATVPTYSKVTLSQSSIVSVNCLSSTGDCYVADNSGYLYYSSNPLGTATTWSTISADATNRIGALSCYSDQFCGVVDNTDAILTSSSPNISPWVPKTNNSLSCISSTLCYGVDSSGDYIAKNGTSISAPASTGDTHGLNSISCVSGPFCVTVDNAGNAYYTTTGTSWSQTASTLDTNSLTSVSCISDTFCMAADASGNYLSYDESTNTWTVPSAIDSNQINSVSCVSGPVCVGVDDGGSYMYYTGSTWYGPYTIQGASSLNSVSCVSSTPIYCYAGDSSGQVFEIELNGGTASLYGWNGTAWSSTLPTGGWTKVDPSAGAVHSITSISCLSTSECAAVDNLGGWIGFNGSSWYETDANFENPMSSISCMPATTDCAALDLSAARSQILVTNQSFDPSPAFLYLNPETDEQSWDHLADKRFETRDIQGIIATLINDSIVNPNQIVAGGDSYGGLQTFALAFADGSELTPDGYSISWSSNYGTISLAAAIPQITATDIFSSLIINGRATDSQGQDQPIGTINTKMEGVVTNLVNPSHQQPAPIGSEDDIMSVINALNAGQSYQSNPIISTYETTLNSYHTVLNSSVPNPIVPIFIIQGSTDLFFGVTQSEELISKLLNYNSNYPVSAFYAGLGHSFYQPSFNWTQGFSLADTWLQQTLFGTAPSPSVTFATTACNNENNSQLVTASTLSTLEAAAPSFADSSAAATSSLSPIFDGGGQCTLPNPSYVGYQSNGNMTITMPPGQSEYNGDSNTSPLGLPTLLVGGITVNANLVTTGLDETFMVDIYDVAPDGTYTEITSGMYKINGPSPGNVSFKLYPNGWTLLVDHSIEVVISQQSLQFQPDTVPNDVVNSTRGVSCVSSQFCVAVDLAGNSYLYSGSSFSGPYEVNPSASQTDSTVSLTSVSCASTSFCLAVSNNATAYYTTNGTLWTPTSSTGDTNPLTSVSCVSTTYCAAVDDNGNFLSYDESTNSWTIYSGVTSKSLTSISCVPNSTYYCMAVDNNGNAYVTVNGTSWTLMSSTGDSNGFTSVSCFAVSNCMAVDNSGNADYYNTSGWTLTNIDGNNDLTSIACTTSNCLISDYNGNIVNWTQSSLTYSQPEQIDLTPDNIGTFCTRGSGADCKMSNFITSISCLSGFCMLVDGAGNYSTATTNLNTWTSPTQVIPKESSMSQISCYTSTTGGTNNCVAVTSLGAVMYYNGSNWTTTSIDSGNSLTSISCTDNSSVLCVAGDNNGDLFASSSPSTAAWSSQGDLDPGNTITSISCPTSSFCVAVDNAGKRKRSRL